MPPISEILKGKAEAVALYKPNAIWRKGCAVLRYCMFARLIMLGYVKVCAQSNPGRGIYYYPRPMGFGSLVQVVSYAPG